MKNQIFSTVVFTLVAVSLPGRACPTTLTAQADARFAPNRHAVVMEHRCYATPPAPFWHDLHWFE